MHCTKVTACSLYSLTDESSFITFNTFMLLILLLLIQTHLYIHIRLARMAIVANVLPRQKRIKSMGSRFKILTHECELSAQKVNCLSKRNIWVERNAIYSQLFTGVCKLPMHHEFPVVHDISVWVSAGKRF